MTFSPVYRFLRKLSDWTLQGFFSEVYVAGGENVARDDPIIIASTHHNDIIDIATLAATIPHRRMLSFWAKSTLFENPISRGLLISSGAIPVKRNLNNGSNGGGLVGSGASSQLPSVSGTPLPQQPNGDVSASTSSAPAGRSSVTDTTSAATATSTKTTISVNAEDVVIVAPEKKKKELNGKGGAQSDLFQESSAAMARGQVIGVFAEGASYTAPKLVQILPGAAWAAVDYIKWVKWGKDDVDGAGGGEALSIIPVGIVYTDKAKYQSRLFIRYGTPIHVQPFLDGLDLESNEQDDAIRLAVKRITEEVERQLLEMTINAPDWETLFASRAARNILWKDPNNVPLQDWVTISQTLVNLFSSSALSTPEENEQLEHAKRAQAQYLALLHYTQMEHRVLEAALPSSPSFSLQPRVTPFLTTLISTLFRLIAVAPTLVLHIPGYVGGSLLARLLAVKGEEESPAQFKAVGAILGSFTGFCVAFGALWRTRWFDTLWTILGGVGSDQARFSDARRVVALAGLTYSSFWLIFRWHCAFVGGLYDRYKWLRSYQRLIVALYSRTPSLDAEELKKYKMPPIPASNPFLKRRYKLEEHLAPTDPPPDGSVSYKRLVGPLLRARVEARETLYQVLSSPRNQVLVEFLRRKGARVPVGDGGGENKVRRLN